MASLVPPQEAASRMSTRAQELAENLAQVRQEIHDACRLAGRSPATVRLVAASKTKPASDIAALAQAGHRDFGENYVQEALEKIDAAASITPPIQWHLIGTLQSNKAKLIPGKFALFHGLHSRSVAEKLNQKSTERKLIQSCLIEINIDAETSKGGLLPEEVPGFLEQLAGLQNLSVLGFMSIPDPEKDPRRAFARLRELLSAVNSQGCYRAQLTELSMGMSHDFREAVLEGATIVRVGTKIFGAREKK